MSIESTQDRLRALVVHCLNTPLGLHSSACFYADKLVTLSKSAPQDVHLLAQAYFSSKQYRRALMVLKRGDMHERELRCKYLAARCLAECKDWEECLSMLGDGNNVDCLNSSLFSDSRGEGELGQAVSLHAAIYLLRARAYEMLDNRAQAIYWYKQALLKDAYCFEAFSALIEGHMLSAEEELELVGRLSLHSDDRWLHLLLQAKCKKYNLHDQMEGILQELEAPRADSPLLVHTHGNHALRPAHTACPPAPAPEPPQPPQAQRHRPLFSPEYTAARPVGPVSPIGMHLDDAMTPASAPTGQRMPPESAGAPAPSATTTPAPNAALGPGALGHAGGPAGLEGPPARRLQSTSGLHGPAEGTDEALRLARTPATPMSTDQHTSGAQASTPNYSAAGMGGRGAGMAAGPGRDVSSGERVQCTTPQGLPSRAADGGGSDMEADTPGGPVHPTPVRTRVGAVPGSAAMAHTGAPSGMAPLGQVPCAPGQSLEQPQRQQQPGAGSSGRGEGCGLRGNLDVLACRADWLYHRRAYEACVGLTGSILDRDPYALQCLPTHLAACVALRRKAELYMRGHKLVEEYPDKAVAWFAVGCYYMCTKQYEQARRYFGKATGLEPNCAAAWIAFGHAFSAQDERDQAMTAYRTASRLFPGLHLAALGMGMEYSQMGNLQLAERMLLAAHQLCPADAATCHELGVLNYRNGQHEAAASWLHAALNLVPTELSKQQGPHGAPLFGTVPEIVKHGGLLSSAWEPTLLALGHCLRKQWRWAEALQLYKLALALCPGQPGTFAALGYTHQLMGNLPEAIQAYHSALAIRPDDSFTVDMLNTALEEYALADI